MGAHLETIEHWVSEFLTSTQGEMQAREFGERAGAVLVSFMDHACGNHVEPAELGQGELTDGIAIGIGRLALNDSEKESTPALLEAFLAYCEASGRLSGGETLGLYARQSATAHLLKKQQRKPTVKVGPNEPCPCGSGLKYKKCCMRA